MRLGLGFSRERGWRLAGRRGFGGRLRRSGLGRLIRLRRCFGVRLFLARLEFPGLLLGLGLHDLLPGTLFRRGRFFLAALLGLALLLGGTQVRRREGRGTSRHLVLGETAGWLARGPCSAALRGTRLSGASACLGGRCRRGAARRRLFAIRRRRHRALALFLDDDGFRTSLAKLLLDMARLDRALETQRFTILGGLVGRFVRFAHTFPVVWITCASSHGDRARILRC